MFLQLEDQKKEITKNSKRVEDECGLKFDISNSGTYIISLKGVTKNDDEYHTCEITIDTTNLSRGEYKGE